ncbi:hypothetical protein Vretifemale_14923 [Volvox reticuliferus]|uniref:UvrD-like helicase C-terminal domain-containing protein n=1 Tax=Volvox reticuliferus TaxID=1737510 RepID=A0A8J4FUM4_9CHLO|nr:hypothetical protein Vretifemale_14923 [Volvox reticuliferus]
MTCWTSWATFIGRWPSPVTMERQSTLYIAMRFRTSRRASCCWTSRWLLTQTPCSTAETQHRPSPEASASASQTSARCSMRRISAANSSRCSSRWRRQRRVAAAAGAGDDAISAGSRVGIVPRRGRGLAVATPQIQQLKMNYRTHQGVLDVAALVVDVLRRYFPRQLDRLERERALFPGPHPLLLGGISSDDLAILLSGSDKNTSQVEFGAHQVILVRTMASVAQLPQDIQDSNAIIMTVPQAKGLEFDDVFIVDFFNDSEANSEWRVLGSYLAELAAAGGVAAADGHQYDMQQVTPPDPGSVRPLNFNERSHVLLAEELKHLYTALTRAKNNVVIFDRNPTKRAPFYHLLQSLGIARTVHRSLLEDGRDAVRYGLTQQATSSRAEWAKRARNLLDNRNYLMARKAFVQAADMVRAEVAEAYLKRRRAADEESPTEQRRLLAGAALQLLAAASRREQSPDPVTTGELRRWLSLAGRCLQACGLAAPAAELAFKAGNHTTSLRMLLAAKEHAAAAECCLDAAAEALRQYGVHQRQHLAEHGGAVLLLDPLAAPPAGTHAAAAAASRKRALGWLAKAVEQVYLTNDLDTLTGLLAPGCATAGGGSAATDSEDDEAVDGPSSSDGTSAATEVFAPLVSELHDMLKRRWAGSYAKALRRVVLRCHARGEHSRARRAARLMPAEAERDTLLARMGYWRELARLKRQIDPLGAAELLLDHSDFAQAARLISEYIASKAPKSATRQRTKGTATATKTAGDGDAVSASAATWAPVDERAWDLLHRCIMAQTEPGGARRLRLQLDRWVTTAMMLEDSFSLPTASAAVGGRMLLCRGHAALLEARLMLQQWVIAGAGSEGKGAGEQHQLSQPSPDSWEQIGSEAAPPASEEPATALTTWRTAAPLLHEAAKCFKRCGHWPGHLEVLALMVQFGPGHETMDAMAEVPRAQVPAGTSAQQTSVPAASTAAASAYSSGLQYADAATSMVRVAQATMAALRERGPTRLTAQQQQHLEALEQLYGLPGLSHWSQRLSAKHATHVWWAVFGPERVSTARAAVLTAQAGGAVGPAGIASALTAPATAAVQRNPKPMGQSYAAAVAKATGQSVAADAIPALATTRQLLGYQLSIAARQAVMPDEAGTMPWSGTAAVLARDLAVKTACLSHQVLRTAIDTYMDAPIVGDGALRPATSEAVLTALRPVVRGVRACRTAITLLSTVEADFQLQPTTLVRSIRALTRRALALVAAVPLAPAQAADFQQDLLQPPIFHKGTSAPAHGALVDLLVSEGLDYNDLYFWIKEALMYSSALSGRFALAPAVSYTAWRTAMLVLKSDELAGRVFKLQRGRLPLDVPAARMIRDRDNTAVPEYLLRQGFNYFARSLPHKAIGDVLYYLAWCCRRDGLLSPALATATTANTVSSTTSPTGAAPAVASANTSQGGGRTPAPPSTAAASHVSSGVGGRCLPLEAYVELVEVAMGQLVLASCDTAFLSANLAGMLAGLPQVKDRQLKEISSRWQWALGFKPPWQSRGQVSHGMRMMRGGDGDWSVHATDEYFRLAKVARDALGKQLLLGARILMVLAGYLARLLAAEDAAGEHRGSDGSSVAVATSIIKDELLPLIEAPSGAVALELLVQKVPMQGRPAAHGHRLLALARRVLLSAASAWLSLELQKRVPPQPLQPQSQYSFAANAAMAEAYASRSCWPADVVPLLREATGMLAMPLLDTATGTSTTTTASRLFSRDLTLATLADQLRQLSMAWCTPGGTLRLVDSRADREFEGFSTLQQAKQFKVQQSALASVYNVAQARVQPPSTGQRGIMGQQAAGQLQAADATGLLRAAVEAVGVVASNDYRPTHDEQTKQSDAAAVIQRTWREWRLKREEAAAAARQRECEEDAIRQLREGMSLQLRISLRVYFTRLRRGLEKRKHKEAQAAAVAAGAAGANWEDGQWDEFGFAAVEDDLQKRETHRYIDEASCPVCQPKHQQQQQQGQKQESGSANSATAALNMGSPSSARQFPGLNAAVADFTPHRLRVEHIAAVDLFRKCHEQYREYVVPMVRWARELMAELGKAQAEMSADDSFMVLIMDSTIALEAALEQLCHEVRQVLAARLWMASGELLNPKWYACQAACEVSKNYLAIWKSAYVHAQMAQPTALGHQEEEGMGERVPGDQQSTCVSPSGVGEVETQSQIQVQKPKPHELPTPRLLLQHLHGQQHQGNGDWTHSEQHMQQQPHDILQQQEVEYQSHPQAQSGNVQGQMQQQLLYVQHHHLHQQDEAQYVMAQSQVNEPRMLCQPPLPYQLLQPRVGWSSAWSVRPAFLQHAPQLHQHHHRQLPVATAGAWGVRQVPMAPLSAVHAAARPVQLAGPNGALMQGHQAFARGPPPAAAAAATAATWIPIPSNPVAVQHPQHPQHPQLWLQQLQHHQHRQLLQQPLMAQEPCDDLPPGLNMNGNASSTAAAGTAVAYTHIVGGNVMAVADGGSGLRVEEMVFPGGHGGDDEGYGGGHDLDMGMEMGMADDLDDAEWAEDKRQTKRRNNRYKNGGGGGLRKGCGGAGAANAAGIPSSPGAAAGCYAKTQQQQQQQQHVPAALLGNNAFAALLHANATPPRQSQGKKGRK